MKLPNFLIIGATKAGTTSLHHYLGQHPDVFVAPTKETNFFAQESALCFSGKTVSLPEEYAAQFAGATTQKAIGESSPAYLAVPTAPARIARMLPRVKLIAILRNPVDRAYSHYLMRRRQGRENRETFEEVLSEPDRDPERSYTERGFYGKCLTRYLKHFSKEKIKIFLYEDLVRDPQTVVRDCFEFLDVNPEIRIDIGTKHNVNPTAQPMSPQTRQHLLALYRADILITQELIHRDLSSWL